MSDTIPRQEAEAALGEAGLSAWTCDEDRLHRTYETAGWPQTMLAANAIGLLAEAAWHHPDLELGYGRLTVRLTSHDAGGVTARDLALARAIEDAVLWRPPAGSPLGAGSPEPVVRA